MSNFVIKSTFSDTSGWTLDAGVSASGGALTSATANTYAYRALSTVIPVGGKFRIDVRAKSPAGIDGFVGFTDAAGGTAHPNGANRIGIGFINGGIHYFLPTALGGGSVTVQMKASYTADAWYRLQVASDGERLTFSVTDDDGSNLVTAGTIAPTAPLTQAYIRFTEVAMTVDSYAAMDDLDGYGDATFNDVLRFYTRTGQKTTDETNMVFVPADYTNGSYKRWVIMNHGSGGNQDWANGDTGAGAVRKELVSRGYLVVCPMAHNVHFGNDSMMTDIDATLKKLRSMFTLYKKGFGFGSSMGTYSTFLPALKHPEWFAAIGINSCSANLAWRYYGTDPLGTNATAQIAAAYPNLNDRSAPKIMSEKNIHARMAELFHWPIRFWHGSGDVTVSVRHASDIVNYVTANGGNATLKMLPGLHAVDTTFDAIDTANFFDSVSDFGQLQGED